MKIESIKIGIFIYWGFCVSSATAADRIYTSRLDHQSQSSGTLDKPANALIPDLSFYSHYPSVQHQLASIAICAVATNNFGGIAYTYQDGVCTIYGPGEGSSLPSNIYAIPTLPSPELLECVSCGKQTYYPSHTDPGWKAVDGSVNTQYSSREPAHKPWWVVDFGETRTVHQLLILPRTHRYHDVEIRIGSELKTNGDLTTYTLICSYKGPYSDDLGFLVCTIEDGISGRYIGIQKVVMGTMALQLKEVVALARKK